MVGYDSLDFDDKVLFHIVELVQPRTQNSRGTTEVQIAERMAGELGLTWQQVQSDDFDRSPAYADLSTAIEALEDAGLVSCPAKTLSVCLVLPTRAGRQQVAALRDSWGNEARARERAMQQRILQELASSLSSELHARVKSQAARASGA